MIDLATALAAKPLIAILHGLAAEQAVPASDTLIDKGFRIIEVPLNAPDPWASTVSIAERHGVKAIVGTGTVLTVAQVDAVADVGAGGIVSPNMNAEVGCAARARGLSWWPGVMTPTEAFTALDAGASILKVFPAEMVPPPAITAMRAVLPKDAVIVAVGGISLGSTARYRDAGVMGVGLGSALFEPTYAQTDIRARAIAFMDAWDSG